MEEGPEIPLPGSPVHDCPMGDQLWILLSIDPQGLAFMRFPTVEEGMADSLD